MEPLFDVITHKWMHVAHTFDSRPYEEEDAARIFRSIVTAVARLHSVNIVHGNLAPDHILLDMDDDTKVYLPDLRWAGQITVESGVTQPLCFQRGTPGYASPEQLHAQRSEAVRFDKEADVWSLGIILYGSLLWRPLFWQPFWTVTEPVPGLVVPLAGFLASRRRKQRKNGEKTSKNGPDTAA